MLDFIMQLLYELVMDNKKLTKKGVNMQTTTFIMKNGKKLFYQDHKSNAISKFRNTSEYKDQDVKFIKTVVILDIILI